MSKPRNSEEGAAAFVFLILGLIVVATCTFYEVRPMWRYIFFGAGMTLFLFRLTIIWEKVIVIKGEKWAEVIVIMEDGFEWRFA